MPKKAVATTKAPQAMGPYSQAIVSLAPFTGMVFAAGQTGTDPMTKAFVEGGVQAQTKQALTNIKNVLEAAGSSLDKVVKTTVFLANMDDFAAMNEVYATFFPHDPPARSTVQVAKLPGGALVEVEAIALI